MRRPPDAVQPKRRRAEGVVPPRSKPRGARLQKHGGHPRFAGSVVHGGTTDVGVWHTDDGMRVVDYATGTVDDGGLGFAADVAGGAAAAGAGALALRWFRSQGIKTPAYTVPNRYAIYDQSGRIIGFDPEWSQERLLALEAEEGGTGVTLDVGAAGYGGLAFGELEGVLALLLLATTTIPALASGVPDSSDPRLNRNLVIEAQHELELLDVPDTVAGKLALFYLAAVNKRWSKQSLVSMYVQVGQITFYDEPTNTVGVRVEGTSVVVGPLELAGCFVRGAPLVGLGCLFILRGGHEVGYGVVVAAWPLGAAPVSASGTPRVLAGAVPIAMIGVQAAATTVSFGVPYDASPTCVVASTRDPACWAYVTNWTPSSAVVGAACATPHTATVTVDWLAVGV